MAHPRSAHRNSLRTGLLRLISHKLTAPGPGIVRRRWQEPSRSRDLAGPWPLDRGRWVQPIDLAGQPNWMSRTTMRTKTPPAMSTSSANDPTDWRGLVTMLERQPLG